MKEPTAAERKEFWLNAFRGEGPIYNAIRDAIKKINFEEDEK